MRIFMLKDTFGTLLTTRETGRKLRLEVKELLLKGYDVIIDFSEIEVLSHSFADEIAKLIAEMKFSDIPRGKLIIRIFEPIQKCLLGTRIKFREEQMKKRMGIHLQS